ncbi:transposase [Bradyrhizobium sp. LA6.1]
MRYELDDYEWTAIKPMLPHKPRDVPRVSTPLSAGLLALNFRSVLDAALTP